LKINWDADNRVFSTVPTTSHVR